MPLQLLRSAERLYVVQKYFQHCHFLVACFDDVWWRVSMAKSLVFGLFWWRVSMTWWWLRHWNGVITISLKFDFKIIWRDGESNPKNLQHSAAFLSSFSTTAPHWKQSVKCRIRSKCLYRHCNALHFGNKRTGIVFEWHNDTKDLSFAACILKSASTY